MHEEARDVLPQLLDAIGFRRGLLLGHSDGASIAAIYAGSVQDHRVRGLVLIAPHFFTEDMGLAEIARAKEAYATTDLRAKLARWHADVDNAFRGWNDAWLDPGFRTWDITDALAYIRVPILIVQGEDDQYGTVQADRGRPRRNATARSRSRCCRACATRRTARRRRRLLQTVADFANRLLRDHQEGDECGVSRSRCTRRVDALRAWTCFCCRVRTCGHARREARHG